MDLLKSFLTTVAGEFYEGVVPMVLISFSLSWSEKEHLSSRSLSFLSILRFTMRAREKLSSFMRGAVPARS